MNCINLVWHDVEGIRGNCDLYIHKQFSGYDRMIPALRQMGLFGNIYECHMPVKSNESKVWHSVIRMAELFFPRRFLDEWAGRKFAVNEYEILLMPAPLRFTVALVDLNRRAAVWFYEDGSANYFGNILDSYGPKSKYLIKKLFNKGHATVVPERMYLNNVAFSGSTTNCKMVNLPRIDVNDAAFMNVLNRVFGEGGDYCGKRVFYLSIPLFDINADRDVNVEETFDSTLRVLLPRKDEVVVRPHPREPEREYCGIDIDRNRTLWELICSRVILDEHILIGSYSTGQMMPKILFDKEPTIVFTYKIYKPVLPEGKMQAMDALVERVRSAYRDPSKVYNVRSLDEYSAVMKKRFV